MKELKWSLEQDSNDNDNALPLLAQKKVHGRYRQESFVDSKSREI
jgi:hypothetical protein